MIKKEKWTSLYSGVFFVLGARGSKKASGVSQRLFLSEGLQTMLDISENRAYL